MLVSLAVRDYAIVERLDLELDRGMTVLTGETGAGKSILVGAVGLAIGERAAGPAVRPGARRAEVVAVFDVDADSEAVRFLVENELEAEEGECILRRVVSDDGRSRGYVNGRAVPIQTLRELGERLVDVHGQQAHQSLTRRDAQRRILDAFAGHESDVASLAALAAQWRECHGRMRRLAGEPGEREARLQYLRHQVGELDALALEPGETASLDEEHHRLAHASELLEACSRCLDELQGEQENTAATHLARAQRACNEMKALDAEVEPIADLLEGAAIQLDEAAAALRRYRDAVDLDPARLQALESRIGAIHDAARKHRTEPEELPELHARLREEIAALESADEHLEALETEIGGIEEAYAEIARAVHERRAGAAAELADRITENVRALGMPGARVEIRVEAQREPRPTPGGPDRVEIFVAVNPGQPLAPLTKVASGGELSRISLAIRVIASTASEAETLIFDEVDAGIGGRVAEIVGRELRGLAGTSQVLCVTHLAQVAAQAHHHVSVRKHAERDTTRTAVHSLDAQARIEELARMLGGVEITDRTRAHARDMLERAGASYAARAESVGERAV